MSFKIRLFFSLFVFSQITSAQHWLGISSSNYAGTNGVFLNPSSVVDSRFKMYINLAGNDLFINNNYLSYNAPYSFLGLITNTVPSKYRNEQRLIIWKDVYYKENLNGKPKDIHVGGDIRGPSFLWSSKSRKYALALTTRGRYQLDLTNVSEQTARVIRFGTDPPELQNVAYKNQQAELSVNGFVEIGATFGMVLKDDEEDFWKAGITVKRMIGMFNTHANLIDGNYSIIPLIIPENREIIYATSMKATYGITSDEALKIRPTPSWIFGNAPAGSGWGMDLGISYEYRPDIREYKLNTAHGGGERYNDPKRNKYKYRISAALNDIGSIRYNNPNLVTEFNVERTNVTFSYLQFDKKGNPAAAVGAVNTTLNLRPSENFNAFKVMLPTTANVSFDYFYKANWYINALWVQGLRGNSYLNISPQSVIAVTPRYEKKWLEISMPISLYNNYSSLGLGIGARVGPVILGSDNLAGLLNIGKPRGLDFYFGIYAPIFHSNPKSPNPCYVQPPSEKRRRK